MTSLWKECDFFLSRNFFVEKIAFNPVYTLASVEVTRRDTSAVLFACPAKLGVYTPDIAKDTPDDRSA